jgi:hypothetical protein
MVRVDDSFLQLMVSDKKQFADIHHAEGIIKENEVLKPFKVFLELPFEICHKPIEYWDEYNTKLVIQGIGFGHTSRWKGEAGQLGELTRAILKVKKETK